MSSARICDIKSNSWQFCDHVKKEYDLCSDRYRKVIDFINDKGDE